MIYGCTGLVVLYFIGLYQKVRDWPAEQPGRVKWVFQILGFSVLVFAVIPAAIYTLSYLLCHGGGGQPASPALIGAMWENQKYMLSYHSGVTDSTLFLRWYQWLFDIRPILYYMDNDVAGYTTRFAAFVNPVICWGGLLAVASCAVQAVRRRCARALFIFIGYLAQLVPWFFIGRITFAYHYFPSVLFLVLALCYVFHTLAEREEMVNWKPAMFAVTGGAVGLYALFYPVLVGIQTPHLVQQQCAGVVPELAVLTRLGGIQCLDTSLRAGENAGDLVDTPGFAPRGAGRGVFPGNEFPERLF